LTTTSSLLGGYSAVSSNAGSDKYGAALVMPNSVGSSFNVVFRARGDAAGAWTYCDRDGSANGYLAAQAPTLTASAVAPGPVAGDFLITEILGPVFFLFHIGEYFSQKIDLVQTNDQGLPFLKCNINQTTILVCDAECGVNHEENHVRFGDRTQ
jgi:hypothetical protein